MMQLVPPGGVRNERRLRCWGLALAFLATAALPAAPQSVLRLSDLSFPRVIAGIPVLVRPTDPTAAKFRITPPRGNRKSLILAFTLPTTITGPGNLAVTYGPGAAAWSIVDQAAGATVFDPAQGLTITIKPNTIVYVWVGGTAHPTPAQTPGDYTGVITLNVTAP